MPEIVDAAACSKVMVWGFRTSFDSLAAANSAKAPVPMPNTSSPTANRVTSRPHSTTRPATSRPGTAFLGLVRPYPMSRIR